MREASKPSLLTGLEEFTKPRNVINPAVTVVTGAVFTNIVNAAVNAVTSPLVGAFGTKDLAGYSSCLKGPCSVNDKGEAISDVRIHVLGAVLGGFRGGAGASR